MAATRQQQRILVVDDEAQVRILLRECFELEGFEVGEADSAEAAIAALERNPSHLVTLDLNLGGDDGLALARRIRATCNVPIVMITGKGDIIDRVVGLELGADDYISKPFHLREVLARVKAVLRRYEAMSPAPQTASAVNGRDAYSFASWTLDLPSRALRSSEGASVELTTAEFNMLALFVERPHRVLSRDNIMDLLKGHEWSPFDRSIDALIVRLRRKIEAEPDTPRLIKTVRGVGYVFAVDVRKG